MPQEKTQSSSDGLSRRRILSSFLAAGGTAAATAAAMGDEAKSTGDAITADMIDDADWFANLTLEEDDQEKTASAVTRAAKQMRTLREFAVDYGTIPAMRFDPEQADPDSRVSSTKQPSWLRTTRRHSEVASNRSPKFASIQALGQQLRSRQTTSEELTEFFLAELKAWSPTLKCVVTETRDLAIKQARRADAELRRGCDRGPLHGIPWGAKDLIAVPDYPTTWGAPQFRDQMLPTPATVYQRLTDAGAVLVAKLSLGALAMGDKWFEGMTRNPWNVEQGSSGSSAGSASAVAAGLVPFAIGSETLGSIVSPSRRCGVTSLRPTFGRVSRAGCMTLSWTMDKLGPMARRVDDIATVFDAIHGIDTRDPTTVHRWFNWPVSASLRHMKIGHVQNARTRPHEQVALDILKEHGAEIVPIDLPHEFPVWELASMLDVEAATVFHDLTASGAEEGLNSWPGIFRKAHFVSATDFIHAQRVRFELMRKMADVFRDVHAFVGGNDLGITNLTGHPSIVLPTMMSDGEHPQPVCCTITGRLYDDATLLALGTVVESAADLTDRTPHLSQAKDEDKD